MIGIFAKAGEPVTDEDGNVICLVKHDLHALRHPKASDFGEFSEGERAWQEGDLFDPRCVRQNPDHAKDDIQIRINREWRP